ncbi:hypothetical protein HYX13_01545 [Candidatus Woesearchaeota archaeon]|nr:hypothetical protein [Candidatus Woesearchaeota archaeon]
MKKDHSKNPINTIRQGNGQWDFTNFMPRISEPETPKDKFTQAFHSLDHALRNNEIREKTRLPYYIHTQEEKQGIFRIGEREINVRECPFELEGLPVTPHQKEYMHNYTRELRKFVEKAMSRNFTPTNRYFATVTLEPNNLAHPLYVALAASMDFNGWCSGVIIPLQDIHQRVLYQIIDEDDTSKFDKKDMLGTGFMYLDKKKEIAFHEITPLEML